MNNEGPDPKPAHPIHTVQPGIYQPRAKPRAQHRIPDRTMQRYVRGQLEQDHTKSIKLLLLH